MPVICGELADQEVSKAKAVEDLDVAITTYPYVRLSADDFERLSYALFKNSHPVGQNRVWDDAGLMLRGADAGRDVVLFRRGSLWGVVQCKRLESRISLPEVLREIAKMILYPEADASLPKITPGTTYFLSLASEPRQTVIDFFGMPGKIIDERKADLLAAVREVLENYDTLSGLKQVEAVAIVNRILPTLELKLLRPVDLDAWMAQQVGVATRFFKHRTLIDSTHVDARLDEIENLVRSVGERVAGVPLMTDVDLKIN